MAVDWTKHQVSCEYCGNLLFRRLFRPKDLRRILRFFCDTTCKGKWQRESNPITREWLIEHYVEKQMNCTQIAKIVGRDAKSVWNWLKGWNIPTRKRGSNEPVLFKKGQPSAFAGKKHSDKTRAKVRAARLKDGHYPKNPDGTPYWKGKRGESHPSWKGGLTPERQAFYSSPEWLSVRPKIYGRAKNKCERCGSRHAEMHIHHIVSFQVKELRSVLSNLILLCGDCHRFVHSSANTKGEFIGKRTLP